MEFKRQARDRTKRIMYKGDIISVLLEKVLFTGVITKVERFGRDNFPELHIQAISSDWKGEKLVVESKKLIFNEYKNSRILEPQLLRSDSTVYQKALELREKITPNR